MEAGRAPEPSGNDSIGSETGTARDPDHRQAILRAPKAPARALLRLTSVGLRSEGGSVSERRTDWANVMVWPVFIGIVVAWYFAMRSWVLGWTPLRHLALAYVLGIPWFLAAYVLAGMFAPSSKDGP